MLPLTTPRWYQTVKQQLHVVLLDIRARDFQTYMHTHTHIYITDTRDQPLWKWLTKWWHRKAQPFNARVYFELFIRGGLIALPCILAADSFQKSTDTITANQRRKMRNSPRTEQAPSSHLVSGGFFRKIHCYSLLETWIKTQDEHTESPSRQWLGWKRS